MKSTTSKSFSIVFALFATFFGVALSYAQKTPIHVQPQKVEDDMTENLFPLANFDEKTIYSLDEARKVQLFDATPDASHWYVVDEFAHWQYITIDGNQYPQRFHEIAATGTKLSPNGDYLLWTGLMHNFTIKGFDSTMTYLHKDTTFIGNWVGDYPSIEFSRSGEHWSEMIPRANYAQDGHKDVVLVDGRVVHEGDQWLHSQFSFSHDENHWAYRTTVGFNENLITDLSDTPVFLYKSSPPSKSGTYDATVWRYTPDVSFYHRMLEGRDYDFQFEHVARVNKTAFSSKASDTVHTYVNFKGKNQGLYRWTNEFLIDDSGKHIAYFAADPAMKKGDDERRAVVVYDGNVVAGPFPAVNSLFMSPSGKHIAFTLNDENPKFYLDKKVAAKTSEVIYVAWSPDESGIAFVAAGQHGKFFVVAGGQRSGLFEQIGRIGWSADGRSIQFAGIRNGKLIHVTQSVGQ
jgi:hypothetical protein